ncbi:MAG: sulfotransferase [Phycisphaeraceae bacterium]|nr:sulfotransferase [Phycisphaeraceae bacterium]
MGGQATESVRSSAAGGRLPDFLIIGAMKAGTTTLYRDLQTHPRVYFPLDKEPGNLCDDRVLTPEGRADYAAHFRRARADQVCGEASTAYTKMPVYTGAAERARSLLGPGLKAIYLVRDPIARIISQHHHELTVGRLEVIPDINEAVRQTARYLDYTRYATQVRPWIDAFGAANVKIVPFERYVRDRRGVTSDLCAFLGLDPRPDLIDPDRVFNAAESKPGRAGRLAWITNSRAYRGLVRPLVGQEVRDRVRRLLHGKPPPRPAPPTPETVRFILDSLRDEMRAISSLAGAGGVLLWDEGELLAKHTARAGVPGPCEKSRLEGRA